MTLSPWEARLPGCCDRPGLTGPILTERHEGYQMVESYYYDRTYQFSLRAEAEWMQVLFCPFCGKELPKDFETRMLRWKIALTKQWLKEGKQHIELFKLLADKFGQNLLQHKIVIATAQNRDLDVEMEQLVKELEATNSSESVD